MNMIGLIMGCVVKVKKPFFISIMLALSNAGIIIFNGISVSQSKWEYIHPFPTGNTLNSISFYDFNNGYSAGSKGTIIRTTDGGRSWITENSGVSTSINRIICLNKFRTIAIGDRGVILTKSSIENFWISRRSPVPYNLHDVKFISDKTGYTAGLGGTVLKTTDSGIQWIKLNTGTSASLFCIDFADVNTGVSGGYNVILKTSDGGFSWMNLNILISPPSQIIDVRMFGRDTIYALCCTPYGGFLKSTDGGFSWEFHSLNLPLLFDGTVDLVRSFSFKDSQTGYIVTDLGTILNTQNGGGYWSSDSTYRPVYEKSGILREVNYFDAGTIFITGGGGTVISSNTCGKSWETISGNHSDIRSIIFQNEYTGYAVGEDGKILKSTNSGYGWETIKIKTDEILNHITFISEMTGFICGKDGVILKSSDSGIKWANIKSGTIEELKHISFINHSTGYICGGKSEAVILKSTDNGESWQKIYGNREMLKLNSLEFINVNKGFACGKFGYLLKTTNGGTSWMVNQVSPEEIFSISFYDEQYGLVAGEDGFIYRTSDSGNTWEYSASGYYNTLFRIKFLTQDIALCAGREGSIIYSMDKGATWNRAEKKTGNSLYDITYTGNISEKIISFVSGEFGTLLKSEIKIPVKANSFIKEKTSLINYFPNPFKTTVNFHYEITDRKKVLLVIYDLTGREIETIINREQNAGKYNAYFDLRKHTDGLNLSSGIYFYSFYLNGRLTASGKMLHLK